MLNDEGIAYSFFMIVIFLGLVMICWIVMGPLVNMITGNVNEGIADGEISDQTRDWYNLMQGLYVGIPGIALIGAFIWYVIRAHEQRRINP